MAEGDNLKVTPDSKLEHTAKSGSVEIRSTRPISQAEADELAQMLQTENATRAKWYRGGKK